MTNSWTGDIAGTYGQSALKKEMWIFPGVTGTDMQEER